MPAALDVDKEQVRMLVLSLGVRGAARKMGIPEGTVQYWSADGKWLADTRVKPASLPPPASMVPRSTVSTKPADALADVLAQGAKNTRIGLTRYAERMAKQAAEAGSLEEAPLLKAVADIHSKIHPPEAQDSGCTLQFFAISGGQQSEPEEREVIDLEPSGESSTDVEDY